MVTRHTTNGWAINVVIGRSVTESIAPFAVSRNRRSAVSSAHGAYDGLATAANLKPHIQPWLNYTPLNFFAIIFCMMVGTASLPHVLMRYFTTPSVREARQSVAWSLANGSSPRCSPDFAEWVRGHPT